MAKAVGVNAAGDQFLSRTAGSGNQNADGTVGNLLYQLENLYHRGATANDVVEAVLTAQLLPQTAILFAQFTLFQHPLDDDRQVLGSKRLRDKIRRSQTHGLDSVFDGAESRHHDNNGFRALGLDLFEQFHPAHTRHLQIGEDEVRFVLPDGRDAFLTRMGHSGTVPLAVEKALTTGCQVSLVIDDDDSGSTRHRTPPC